MDDGIGPVRTTGLLTRMWGAVMATLHEKLVKIQTGLKAPKGQKNTFGNYNYRSCEDILEAVKPSLDDDDLTLLISDEMILVGDRVYVKATATISDGETSIFTTGNAREALTKKGMDEAQITGAASSYARKYALNGLLAIDDTKDADSTNTHGKESKRKLTDTDTNWINAVKADPKVIDQITDPEYKKFIESEITK